MTAAPVRLLTTAEIAVLLHVDADTVYREVREGRLPALRVGRQWRFDRDDVLRAVGSSPPIAVPSRWLPRRGS